MLMLEASAPDEPDELVPSPKLIRPLFLTLTLVALGVTVVSGFKARRKIHIPAVATSVVLLLVTIYYAEQLGTQYDLEAAGDDHVASSIGAHSVDPLRKRIAELAHPSTLS